MIISAPLDNEFKEMSERLLGKQACPAAGQHAMGLAVSRAEEGCVCAQWCGRATLSQQAASGGTRAFERLSGQGLEAN